MRLPCCLYRPPIINRQRLGKQLPAPTNTRATVEELLDAMFYQSVSCQILNI
jgi:hypothetical protein